MEKYNISVYDEDKHEGIFRHLLVRFAFNTKQVLVTFITTSEKFPHLKMFTEELITAIPQITGIVLNFNNKRNNVIL